MNINIINIHVEKPRGYLYIGRSAHDPFHHFGNPFTHLWGHTQATVQVATREQAVQAYEEWLRGTSWLNVEQERRAWILRRIDELAVSGSDLTLGCFCKPRDGFKNDHTCHGQVLAKMIEEARDAIRAF